MPEKRLRVREGQLRAACHRLYRRAHLHQPFPSRCARDPVVSSGGGDEEETSVVPRITTQVGLSSTERDPQRFQLRVKPACQRTWREGDVGGEPTWARHGLPLALTSLCFVLTACLPRTLKSTSWLPLLARAAPVSLLAAPSPTSDDSRTRGLCAEQGLAACHSRCVLPRIP